MRVYNFIHLLISKLDSLRTQERGATAVEYALIVGGLAVVIIAAVAVFGDGIAATFARIACQIQTDKKWEGGACVPA